MNPLEQQDTDSDLSRKAEQDNNPLPGKHLPERRSTPRPEDPLYSDPLASDPNDEPLVHDLQAHEADGPLAD
ncbi:hypothetical protein [Chromobacterium vaccinii]|uniref:hypothetical protein n=1 Tax=Chromobacterium vaccinii TaxID=1108595 RepID=UPI000E17AD56|nr:hypothetical protein [Chromobacterium vaccinii]QND85085.1 Uncharacterized protein ChrSW_2859 [Chromobacterium vaccinii]QND90316.1 Uncharacterized protein ChrSV_2859 [Chromobacterium vaccinii]SUX55334.1 Uncharacterised protein [Chromobacterium vaccinii]